MNWGMLHIVCPHCDTVNCLAATPLRDGPKCGSCKGKLFDGHHAFGLNDKQKGAQCTCGLPRRATSEQRAHQDAEIEAGDVDQIALVNIFRAAQPGAAHATAIEDICVQ